jgi:hypothetical protein
MQARRSISGGRVTLAHSAVQLPDSELRAADAERQAAATRLQDHFAAGRLTWEELDERLGQAWAARTRGALAVLFTDLPAPVAPKVEQPRQRFRPPADPRLLVLVLLAAGLIFLTDGFVLIPIVAFVLIRGHRHSHRSQFAGGPHDHHRRRPHGHHNHHSARH